MVFYFSQGAPQVYQETHGGSPPKPDQQTALGPLFGIDPGTPGSRHSSAAGIPQMRGLILGEWETLIKFSVYNLRRESSSFTVHGRRCFGRVAS